MLPENTGAKGKLLHWRLNANEGVKDRHESESGAGLDGPSSRDFGAYQFVGRHKIRQGLLP